MENRRRSPIPPPRESREFRDGRDGYRRDDRRGPASERRRPRSMSPDRNPRGRSPPPYKRYRREDEFYDDRSGGPSGGYRRSPPRRRPSPSYRGGGGGMYDEQYEPYREDPRARAPIDAERPMTFKEFMIYGVGDEDVGPDVAQARFQEYLAAWWGDHIKAEFEQRKGEEGLRAKFDPRVVEKALRMRNEAAREAAARFAEELRQGKYDPSSDNFNQGALELAPADDDASAPRAPVSTWTRTRLSSDLILSRQLMAKLDAEREVATTNLLAADQAASGDTLMSEDGGSFSLEGLEPAKRLDLQLTYLWNVHGVDYYAGREIEPALFSSRVSSCRQLRPPCPEDPEAAAKEAAAKSDAVTLAKQVDECWNKRMQLGDPDKVAAQLDRVDTMIDAWIETQIDEEEPNKWSNKLSNKRFVGKQFVVKHIRTKHADKVEEVRSKYMEEVYFENFRAAKEAEEKEAEAAAAVQQQQQQQQAGGPAAPPLQFQPAPPPHPPPPQTAPPPRFDDAQAFHEGGEEGYGPGPMRSTLGPRRGVPPPRMVGRGGAMMRMGRGVPLMEAPMMAPMPMGGPMAPIFMPAPGPGPMGPIILAPMQPGAGPMPMPMDPFGGRGRGMRPRGRGRGPFPGGMMMAPGTKLDPQGYREYYDLDAPHNNRAVLDYGDL